MSHWNLYRRILAAVSQTRLSLHDLMVPRHWKWGFEVKWAGSAWSTHWSLGAENSVGLFPWLLIEEESDTVLYCWIQYSIAEWCQESVAALIDKGLCVTGLPWLSGGVPNPLRRDKQSLAFWSSSLKLAYHGSDCWPLALRYHTTRGSPCNYRLWYCQQKCYMSKTAPIATNSFCQ